MAVLSGKAGTLKLAGATVTPISHWRLQWTCSNKAYAANDTQGARRRVAGVEDCSGSFECKVSDNGSCPVRRGEAVVAEFHVDGSGQNYYSVPIVAERISVDCDINQGEIVAFVVEFSGDGPLESHGVLSRPD